MSYRPNSVIHSQATKEVIECDVRQIEMHTAEQLVPDPSPFEDEIAIATLKKYKLPSSDQNVVEPI
jgi:hypothetical protein